jgi:hypothetical protein
MNINGDTGKMHMFKFLGYVALLIYIYIYESLKMYAFVYILSYLVVCISFFNYNLVYINGDTNKIYMF